MFIVLLTSLYSMHKTGVLASIGQDRGGSVCHVLTGVLTVIQNDFLNRGIPVPVHVRTLKLCVYFKSFPP